jgi:hypothetical protein
MMRDQERADAAKSAYVEGLIDTVAHPVVRLAPMEAPPPAEPVARAQAPQVEETVPASTSEPPPARVIEEVVVRTIPGVAFIATATSAASAPVMNDTTPAPVIAEANEEAEGASAPPEAPAEPHRGLGRRIAGWGALFGRGAQRSKTDATNE